MNGSYFSSDTIAAVATSLAGDAGVGIIRLSGPKALLAAQRITEGLENPQARVLHRVRVISEKAKEFLDDGLGVVFEDQHSFTGEEVVELQLHGGRFLLQTILREILETGLCRMALAGEFSFRAVRNGKTTLSQAQATHQLIGAQSGFEITAAQRQRSGREVGTARCNAFCGLGEAIRALLSKTEIAIDFSDQDIEVLPVEQLRSELTNIRKRVEELHAELLLVQRVARGIDVALIGAPNVGKSTLFNAILSEERAIVSPEAGTTRDVITEEFSLPPYRIRLADTAGLRIAGGAIEQQGILKASIASKAAEQVILVIDPTGDEEVWVQSFQSAQGHGLKPLVAVNKADCVDVAVTSAVCSAAVRRGWKAIAVSANRGEGIAALLSALKSELDEKLQLKTEAFLPTEFQLQMLVQCADYIREAQDIVEGYGTNRPELVSSAVSGAARTLSDLAGETTPETVLAKIFSEFCVGK